MTTVMSDRHNGHEDACAAVHQHIAYKSGSVHMDTVSVQPSAQSDTLRKPHDLQSLLAARQHRTALSTLTLTMLKSLLTVRQQHLTFHCHRHCCIRPPVVCHVDVADCRQIALYTVHARCKLVDASFDALVIQRR